MILTTLGLLCLIAAIAYRVKTWPKDVERDCLCQRIKNAEIE